MNFYIYLLAGIRFRREVMNVLKCKTSRRNFSQIYRSDITKMESFYSSETIRGLDWLVDCLETNTNNVHKIIPRHVSVSYSLFLFHVCCKFILSLAIVISFFTLLWIIVVIKITISYSSKHNVEYFIAKLSFGFTHSINILYASV